MNQQEYIAFLIDLVKSNNKTQTANDFAKEMINKYGNQFDCNGYIDELIKVLEDLKNINK